MVRVRFAPSPTGYLHIGNGRTAILNYLFARSKKGVFILRIEDTDLERSSPVFETSIIYDLKWLGIEWDEGPIRQSERLDIYRKYARMFLEKRLAYRCFCTKEELEEMKKNQIKKGEPPRYNGKCREIGEETAEAMELEGRPYVVRFKSLRKRVSFDDAIHGKLDFPDDHVDDFIILKQDGWPSYNFAATVDDLLMGITHVIRGADHISNTPKQLMLFEVLGASPPVYCHHSLLIGKDRKPLSKRDGITGIREFREMGILPSALFNYIAVIGRGIDGRIMDRETLIDTFEPSSLSCSDSLFDMERLLWYNREYLKTAPPELLMGTDVLSDMDRKRVLTIRENARTLTELKDWMGIFKNGDITEEGIGFLLNQPGSYDISRALLNCLLDGEDHPFDHIADSLGRKTGMKKRELFLVLRVLTTGRLKGPPLHEVFNLIPKDIIIKRIRTFLHQD
ncbi:MAG: glutamate--tRNA ligase [Syntrophorhabdaceae bacterium]|nr:glutamate--tRNA ligase [Syntrophorhabdaceae bacterium]